MPWFEFDEVPAEIAAAREQLAVVRVRMADYARIEGLLTSHIARLEAEVPEPVVEPVVFLYGDPEPSVEVVGYDHFLASHSGATFSRVGRIEGLSVWSRDKGEGTMFWSVIPEHLFPLRRAVK